MVMLRANILNRKSEVTTHRAGTRRERVAMAGDRLYVDIVGGRAAGLRTVPVTGHRLVKGFDREARAVRAGILLGYVIPET